MQHTSGILLLSLVSMSQALDYTPTASRYWKGSDGWGDNLRCGDGEVMVGVCSSGTDTRSSCWVTDPTSGVTGRVRHAIECEHIGGVHLVGWESSKATTDDRDVSCDSFSAGLCAGGPNSDCINSDTGESADTRLYCAEPSTGSNVRVQTDQSSQCGGPQLQCPSGQAVQRACTSGRGANCGGAQFGCDSGIRTAIKCTALTIATCAGESREILSNSHASYNATDATISVLSNASDTWTELVDFSTNKGNNAVYRNACNTIVGSMYVEFTYKLSCTAGDISLDVFVAQHPRCVSDLCTDLDYKELLEQDVVQLTVERNGNDWDCTGGFIDAIPSVCSFQTDVLNSDTDIIFARGSMSEPSIQQKKFLFGTISDQMVVTYDHTDESISPFETACMEGGGFVEFASAAIACANTAAGSVTYHVTSYPVCFAETCADDLSDNSLVVATRFQETMVGLDQMEPSTKCSIDAAGLLIGPQDESFLEKYGLWMSVVVGLVLIGIGIAVLQSRGGEHK